MKATVTSPESWKKEISIEIPSSDVDSSFQEKINKYKKEVNLPGFRPGKVPVKLIEQRFGDSIRGEVIDELMNKAYQTACTENKITPIAEPVISDVKIEDGSDVNFKATVEVDPEIEITDYRDLGVKVVVEDTTDAEIDDAINNIREQYAEFSDLDSESKEGTVLTIKYQDVRLDGDDAEGFSPAPQMVEIGKAPIDALNGELTGLNVGDEKSITVEIPADFRIPEASGKKCEFTAIIEKVQEKTLPEINDDLAKKLNFDTVEILRTAVIEDIKKHKENNAKGKAQDEAIDLILAKNDFEVPATRITHYINHIMKEEERYYPNGGMPSLEEYTEKYTEVAKKSLKRFRILDAIAKTEKVKATQEEVDAKIQEIADQYQQPFDTIKQAFRQNGTTVQIREDVKEGKTLDALIGLAEWPSK